MLPTTDSTPAGLPSAIIFRAPIALIALLGASAAVAGEPARAINFNREIRPILSNHCFRCHGPDARNRKGLGKPLRLDTEQGALADLGGYAAIVRGNPEESELIAHFDGREVAYGFGELDELVLAYATTIHKSQGSEYPAVVIPLTTQHYTMLARNLLYTGVTRGKRLVVLVGQRRALAIAVKNGSGRRRWSKLREWLAPGSALSSGHQG